MAVGTPTADALHSQDVQRARELFRHVMPGNLIPGVASTTALHDGLSITTGLAPLCELVALRCKAARVLLNVMDRETMYTLSEASNPENDSESDLYLDPVIQACSAAVPLKGRVCEIVVRMTTAADVAPTFVVSDLSKSSFKHLDVVTGPPYFRFYAGTPITTKDGITIGSLALLDPRPRDGLTAFQERCLTRMAAQIMSQLETNRKVFEGMRSMRLARSLEFFIAGKTYLSLENRRRGMDQPQRPDQLSPTSSRTFTYGLGQVAGGETYLSEPAKEKLNNDEDETNPIAAVQDDSRSHIFIRAANLMREGIGSLGKDGSVVFVSLENRLLRGISDTRHVEVLAASTASSPTFTDRQFPNLVLKEDVLAEMIKRYPQGQVFFLDEPFDLLTKTNGSATFKCDVEKQTQAQELNDLQCAFPFAKQVLFAPMWSSDVNAYIHAVFLTNSTDDYSLSSGIELSFLKSFCDSIATECARAAALEVAKQKSDFVGTISHEMRSPLHGILASAEFLTDTQPTDYQRSLVDAVQSCGRTLLDTIDHVLDYSKISTFRKNWRVENGHLRPIEPGVEERHSSQVQAPAPAMPALIQLTSLTDVGVLVEEVVDNLVLGQSFVSTADITDLSRLTRGRGADKPKRPQEAVDILIDLEKTDWTFMTQPGAIRRVVLNLAGNALKYTVKGHVHVKLELSKDEENSQSIMVLTVTDTGKGIGNKFLNTSLYMPFAQENPLAPGTGLGLSIVHSIVTMLGGHIKIQSEVGKGTIAKVTLPLQVPLPGQVSSNTTPSTGSSISSQAPSAHEAIHWLQTQVPALRTMMYQLGDLEDQLEAILNNYIVNWYGLGITDRPCDADLIIVNEDKLDLVKRLVSTISARRPPPAILVLCSVVSKHDFGGEDSDVEGNIRAVVERVSTPVGPHKLAKAIKTAFQRATLLCDQSSDTPGLVLPLDEKSSDVTPTPTPQRRPHGPEEIVNDLHELVLSINDDGGGGDNDSRCCVVQASEDILASQTSPNAQRAIYFSGGRVDEPAEAASAGDASFPFPEQKDRVAVQINGTDNGESEMAAVPIRKIKPSQKPKTFEPRRISSNAPNNIPLIPPTINPCILVVDDNRINSSLLKTFLTRKRRYTHVDCAENGQEALEMFVGRCSSREKRYDIIFMDISMPIMDGFETTRAIRRFERDHNRSNDRNDKIQNGKSLSPSGDGRDDASKTLSTMIIALTGLSSDRDQSEGFSAGMDIYMTKPVSLKAVGSLLDNWESNEQDPQQPSSKTTPQNEGVDDRGARDRKKHGRHERSLSSRVVGNDEVGEMQKERNGLQIPSGPLAPAAPVSASSASSAASATAASATGNASISI